MRDIVGDASDDKAQFIEGLKLAESEIESFNGKISNEYLRDVLEQGEAIGYIQRGHYAPSPFLETITALLNLLRGNKVE